MNLKNIVLNRSQGKSENTKLFHLYEVLEKTILIIKIEIGGQIIGGLWWEFED